VENIGVYRKRRLIIEHQENGEKNEKNEHDESHYRCGEVNEI